MADRGYLPTGLTIDQLKGLFGPGLGQGERGKYTLARAVDWAD